MDGGNGNLVNGESAVTVDRVDDVCWGVINNIVLLVLVLLVLLLLNSFVVIIIMIREGVGVGGQEGSLLL
jgi:hypothetical protein